MGADPQFLFVTDSLALDLVNTEKLMRGSRVDLLQTPEVLTAWWEVASTRYPLPLIEPELPGGSAVPGERQFMAIKGLRNALRAICAAIVAEEAPLAADLAVLNRELGRGAPQLALGDVHGEQAKVFAASYRVAGDASAIPQFALALAALQLLTTADLARLHCCQSDRCILFFYDTTKSATRRWCSPACMNRARSAQHYAEHKQRDV